MSLIGQGLRRWARKLPAPVGSVNRSHAARRRRYAPALAGAATALAVGCRTPLHDPLPEGHNEVHGYLGSPSRAPAAGESVDSAPELVWRAQAGRGTLGAVAMGDRVTAVTTVDRWVYALDTRTGRRRWRWRGDQTFAVGPLIAHGRVYVGTEGHNGRLTALSATRGKKRWSARVGDVRTPLAYRDGTVYGAAGNGFVFAYRADNGQRRWRHYVGPTRSGVMPLGPWLVVVTLTDTLAVLDAATGDVLARKPLPTTSLSPPARLDDSTIVFTSPAGGVLAVRVPTGELRWRVETLAPVFGAPAVVADTIFALSNACTLWRIPANASESADSASLGCVTVAAPAVLRRGVLVATVGGELIQFDRGSGRVVWTRKLPGELRHPPAVRHGQIIAAPIVGAVHSYR